MTSAIVLAKNEELHLDACLTTLTFCDEIIVVDNGSTDTTVEIARKHNARILSSPDIQDFAHLRNSAMKEAQGDWVLFIDADERVSDELQQHIAQAITNTSPVAYQLKRRDHWWGTVLTHGEVANAAKQGIIRLMKKDAGIWMGSVHERFIPTGRVQIMEGYIEHYPHQTLNAFIADINQYSSQRARELASDGLTSSGWHIICYPFCKFIYTYIFRRGFLDGVPGFVYSFLMSFHSFLVRSKLYMLHRT